MDAHNKSFAQTASLKHGAGMAWVTWFLELAAHSRSKSQWTLLTVVAKVEAPVYPNAILGDGNILLRIYWPLAGQGNLLIEGCGIHWRMLELNVWEEKMTGNWGLEFII